MQHLVGIDLGTQGVKGALYVADSEKGKIWRIYYGDR